MSLMKQINVKFYVIHVIVAIIAVACVLMNGPMRDGLPVSSTLTERIDFIVENHLLWSLSWCVWMVSALGLFVFCAILASELQHALVKTIGLTIVAMGVVPDLIAEALYAFVIPQMIISQVNREFILLLESMAMHLTGYLGNGLYNLGGLVLTLLAIKERLFTSWIAVWGVLSWVLGLMLSVSIAINNLSAAEFFTASSMVLSTLWMLIFAHKVLK